MKNLTKDWFNQHPLKANSAARLTYSMVCYPGFDSVVDGMIASEFSVDKEEADKTDDVKSLLRMLRKGISPGARAIVFEKLLAMEDEMLPLLQESLLKTFNDMLAENGTRLLCDCRANVSDWIMENFENIRYPYPASMLCLVLGFRGTPEVIDFLKEKVLYFEKKYPSETFDQAPLLALYRLEERFDA